MAPKENHPCLGCGKQCTQSQYSVLCTMCSLWSHKECAGLTDAYFKNLEMQKKEMGIAYWACRSCLNFASKMNTKLKEVDRRIDQLKERVEENTDGLGRAKEKIDKVEKSVETVEQKVEDAEKRMENQMYEEMRAREAIRRNLVIYGVEEQTRESDKERMEADLAECERVFSATGVRAVKWDIRFCRRIGEREKGKGKRPILVGMKSEAVKVEILDAAKELQNTRYKYVSIGPDQTRKQREAEKKMNEEVDRKNKEELSEQDRAKNLKWMAVGRKGEKRIIKAPAREGMENPGPTSSSGWRTERRGEERRRYERGGDERRREEMRRDERRGEERRRDERRNQQYERGRSSGTRRESETREGGQQMDIDTEDALSKRGRESGSETEEESGIPPKTRSKH
jgi:hypothetical protein